MARKIFIGSRALNATGGANTDNALLVSFDGGSTWSQSTFGGGGYWTDVYNITATSDYSYVYVASQTGLYVNLSGGANGNWIPSSGSGKSRNISNVTNAVVGNNKLWVSEGHPSINNSGGLYSASTLELNSGTNGGFGTVVDYIASKSIKSTFLYGNNLYAVGKDSSGGVIYIINTTAAAPSTIYTGSAYVYQNTNTSRPNDINDVYVNANGIYLATNTGLYICTDLVPTVSSVFTKIYDSGADIVRKIRYYNNTIYLATTNGLQYATDNGASTTSWTARTTANGLRQNYIKGLHVDSSGLYVGYGGTVAAEEGLSKSTDNGSSWTTTLYNNINGSTNNSNVYSILSFNVNATPTNITLSASSVAENQAIGTTVGTLTTTDADAGDTFTYSLSGTDAASFSITGNALKTAAVFDYETKASYSISITTTDSAGATYTKPFTITVTNVNEAPTNITLSSSSVAEGQAIGTTIGTLSTTDPDAGNTFSYTLGGTDAASFSITGNALKTASVFDYETKTSYSINVTATDQGGLTYTKAFTITVTNVNEAPTNITLSNSSVAENQPSGTTVGALSTTDPDAGNTFTYTLGGTDAASFSITGSTLKTAAMFDYETKASYSISVMATDQGGLSYTKAFTINVTNDPADDNIPLTSVNSVVLANNIIVATVAADPRTIPVLKDGNPLPTGSIVRNTLTNQKFVKIDGVSTAFAEISITPPISWNWSQEGIDAWAILQSF